MRALIGHVRVEAFKGCTGSKKKAVTGVSVRTGEVCGVHKLQVR